jgi:proton-dependent oligopeptide transporter, POT family
LAQAYPWLRQGCFSSYLKTLNEIMIKVPRDLIVCFVAFLGETYVYFLFSYMLMPYLVNQVGLTDVSSGTVYAVFGCVLLLMTIAFGSLVDRLLLRRTLQLQLAVGFASSVLFSISNNPVWTCIVLFGPCSFALAVGLPAIPVAVKRYTTPLTQTVGFGALFVIANIATAAAQLSADVFRIYILPYSHTAWFAYLSAHSIVFIWMAAVHFINFVLVTLFVRNIYVVDESWQTRAVSAYKREEAVEASTILRDSRFWYFVLLSLATTGAKSIYRYLDSLYPLYMQRAPYPVEHPEAMPYMTLLLLNPLLACLLTPLFSIAATRWRVHPFDIILLGCLISAVAPFLMIIVQYWAVIIFVVILTVGEALWNPMLQRYTNEFCDPGTEGMFFALATVPLFAAKVISGSLTGLLLNSFCTITDCQRGWIVWLIIGCITATSPLLLITTCKWTRIKRTV